MNVQEIVVMRARLATVKGIAETLAASWDTFAFVQAVADDCADRAPGMFAAFMFAAASAVDGRDAVGFAPSMPASPGVPAGQVCLDAGDVDEVADELADLVSALSCRLQATAGQADNPGDRQACEHAAREAGRIRDLLGAGPDR